MVKEEPDDSEYICSGSSQPDSELDLLAALRGDRNKDMNSVVKKENIETSKRRSYTLKQKIDALGWVKY